MLVHEYCVLCRHSRLSQKREECIKNINSYRKIDVYEQVQGISDRSSLLWSLVWDMPRQLSEQSTTEQLQHGAGFSLSIPMKAMPRNHPTTQQEMTTTNRTERNYTMGWTKMNYLCDVMFWWEKYSSRSWRVLSSKLDLFPRHRRTHHSTTYWWNICCKSTHVYIAYCTAWVSTSIESKGHWTVQLKSLLCTWSAMTALWLLVRVAGATCNGCLSGRIQGIVALSGTPEKRGYIYTFI